MKNNGNILCVISALFLFMSSKHRFSNMLVLFHVPFVLYSLWTPVSYNWYPWFLSLDFLTSSWQCVSCLVGQLFICLQIFFRRYLFTAVGGQRMHRQKICDVLKVQCPHQIWHTPTIFVACCNRNGLDFQFNMAVGWILIAQHKWRTILRDTYIEIWRVHCITLASCWDKYAHLACN